MPTFVVFRGGENTGVQVEGLGKAQHIVLDGEGRVERIRGADKRALEAVVAALVKEEGLPVEGRVVVPVAEKKD